LELKEDNESSMVVANHFLAKKIINAFLILFISAGFAGIYKAYF
jgi:hypothetical protein